MKRQLELFPNLPLVRAPGNYWCRYRSYQRSAVWRQKRFETLEMAEGVCQAQISPDCEGYATQVHHLHYLSWWTAEGDKPGKDMIAICGTCHRLIHNIPDADNDNEESGGDKAA